MDSHDDKARVKWYFDPLVVAVAILAAGPLAIPLVIMSPAFKRWHKVAITIAVILITIWAIKASADIYRKLLSDLQLLKDALKQQ